jgi:hypothetical protein
MKRFLLALCSLLLAVCLRATELTDLGQGLSYLRIHSVAEASAALHKAVSGAGPLVLDLRYVTADEASAATLKQALAARPATAQLFILVSPATAPALAPAIATSSALTLGAPESVPAPKVRVQTDAAADRRAYDALEAGTELSKLITGKIEKERFDEASLVKEFKDGNHGAEPAPPVDPTAPKPEATAGKEPAATPPSDRVLQRAVHLHRALQALRR